MFPDSPVSQELYVRSEHVALELAVENALLAAATKYVLLKYLSLLQMFSSNRLPSHNRKLLALHCLWAEEQIIVIYLLHLD